MMYKKSSELIDGITPEALQVIMGISTVNDSEEAV
jgi:hypothetical protein